MASTSRSVERSLQLVRLLATAGRRGLALTDLARMTDLSHSTVHRLLQQLVSERLASQMDQSRRYALGPLAYELGIAAAPRFDIWQPARALLRAFAEEVGDTVYLVARSGMEAVCLERIEGPSPVRVLTLDAGSRRPLGLGAGGLAILAALPEDERRPVIDSVASAVFAPGAMTIASLSASIDEYQRNGYAHVRNRVTLGTSAIGVHIGDILGRPIAAISVAAIDSRMDRQRIAVLAKQLHGMARQIQHTLRKDVIDT